MSALGCFAHGIRNSIGFTNTQANVTVIITSHNCDTELEAASTFYNLGHTSDFDNALVILLF
jgi:hypothetical protein